MPKRKADEIWHGKTVTSFSGKRYLYCYAHIYYDDPKPYVIMELPVDGIKGHYERKTIDNILRIYNMKRVR